MKPKIFDCITFYNANMLFQTRFNILEKYVDYFVVCEASKSHTGKYKGYNFDLDFLNRHKKKIIYLRLDNLPNIKKKSKKHYGLLKIQMEYLFEGIKNANQDDLIIFSDEDEIPNPKNIESFNYEKHKFGLFLQNMYYYKMNILGVDEGDGNWAGSRICKKKYLKSFFKFRLLKKKNINYPFWRFDKEKNIQLINNGGWHFTYLMKSEEIVKKIEDMAHTEFNENKFKDLKEIQYKIDNLLDPFGRDLKLKKVKIDENFPEYIRNNKNLFKDWILL